MKEKLIAEISKGFSGIEFLHPYAAATFLDPRYKKFVFQNPRAASLIVNNLGKKVELLFLLLFLLRSSWCLS